MRSGSDAFAPAAVSLVLRALRYASEMHQEQTRKGSKSVPYINHPIEVAEILWEVGEVRDPVSIAAALLHDTVEDTAATFDDLSERFGNDLRDLVAELSDDKSLEKSERKRLQVETSGAKSLRAREIKLADKIANVGDIGHDPPDRWTHQRKRDYLDWSERVVAGLRGTNSALEQRFDLVLTSARGILAREENSE